jgi:hypothetical protein
MNKKSRAMSKELTTCMMYFLGFKWRIDIQKSDTTEQEFDTPSDNFIQIYSENGRSENIYLVKNSYTIDGPVLSIETMLNMTNPIKIRITHYDANGENRWYLERVNNHITYIFYYFFYYSIPASDASPSAREKSHALASYVLSIMFTRLLFVTSSN